MKNEYVCECGKVFDAPQRFNGHKSHCKIHLSLTGNLEKRLQLDAARGQMLAAKAAAASIERNMQSLNLWLAEKHVCETCGNLMTEKFGSGRFCSRSCANANHPKSKHSIEAREKSIARGKAQREANVQEYLHNPNICEVCGTELNYDHRKRKTCSTKCANELISMKSSYSAARHGGNNNMMGTRGTARYGTYRGTHCDSSYELAFLIYCIDHNINIVRNTDGFPYLYSGKMHTYYPDFKVNNSYIEIKNYNSARVQAKINALPLNISYFILYLNDIKPCIDYCIETYGKDFTSLYDQESPSWLTKK